MSGAALPKPRNIRGNWIEAPIGAAEALGDMRKRGVPESWGDVVEARSWKVARGHRKGATTRIDALFGDGKMASLRFSGGFYTLRVGDRAAI